MSEDQVDATRTVEPGEKRAYAPPSSVVLSGSKDDEYGAAIVVAAAWAIAIGAAWAW